MPNKQPLYSKVRFRLAVAATLVLLGAGCVTQEEKGRAINAVNQAFRIEYEAILAQSGTRAVTATPREAFDTIRTALTQLGFKVESQNATLGYLAAFAPAPRPLDLAEWRKAADADLPHMREILRPHIGMMSDHVRFEPEGLQVLIHATVLDGRRGSDVSLTMRMREISPPPSGMPRREYAPPTAVRMGLEKIWAAFDQELQRRSSR